MSNLKLQVTRVGSILTIKVLYQKYRAYNFFRGKNIFTASNGFVLHSVAHLSMVPGQLFTHGSLSDLDEISIDLDTIPNAIAYVDKLKIAVREYNGATE